MAEKQQQESRPHTAEGDEDIVNIEANIDSGREEMEWRF